MTDDKVASEAYKQEYGDMEPDHPCVPDVWKNGFNAGRKAERERFFKALDGLLEDNGGLTTHECLQILRDELGGQDGK